MTKGSFRIPGGVGFCNAVRRSLLSDIEGWAGYEVDLRVNTSCQTDEYLAHRLGQLPLRPLMNDGSREMTLCVTGPCTAMAAQLVGPGFEVVHPDVEILRLGPNQTLDLTLKIDRRPAHAHARYAMVSGVGMAPVPHGDPIHADHTIVFETLDHRPPKHVMEEALAKLDARVDAALLQLAHQPVDPPPSMC